MDVKFPNVKVKLVGEDGNAFAIMGRVTTAMRRKGCTIDDIRAYREAATSSTYDHLLQVTMETVSCK
jgi:uncharacterized protein YpbB